MRLPTVYIRKRGAPQDPARSARCFQKAFELDASQADAARRLASGFADEREWDLVEAVARRAIAGEGGLGGGLGESEGEKNVTTAAAFASPSGGILARYQLLTPGLILALAVGFFVLVPIALMGISALAGIQSPLQGEAPKGYIASEKKNQ